MDYIAILTAVLTLLSGIGVFLIACQMMSSNLESASSERLKKLFSRTSSSKLLGVGIGTVSTALIQSSGATTVMTIGFVNAGIISLFQAATLIYGANIGTTVTAQIVALGMFGGNSLSTTIIFSALTGIGAFVMLFSKKSRWKTAGGIITGFGMLFVGLSLMSGSMESFAELEGVKSFLAAIRNPVLLVLIGALLTAIIQSSSVMTSIALAMVVTGLITLDQGILLTMGSNIGSCIVALLAGFTSGLNARRTALIHLLFNLSGVALFMLAGWIIGLLSHGVSFGTLFEFFFPGAPQTQLAMFHTFFNTVTVAVMLPLPTPLVNLVCRMLPEQRTTAEPTEPHLHYVNENLFKTAPVAVQQTRREILRMASLAMKNVDRALNIVTGLDFSAKGEFARTEDELDYLNTALVDYVVKLSTQRGLSQADKIYLSTTFRSIRDLERIGDYAENIVEYADTLAEQQERFSDDALYEISQLKTLLFKLYDCMIHAYRDSDYDALSKAYGIEEQTDEYTRMMEDNHIRRLEAGICTPVVGAQYLALSSNAERIADHLINVAKTIKALL